MKAKKPDPNHLCVEKGHLFKFKQTKKGMRRKCSRCGYSITEVANGVFGKGSVYMTAKGYTQKEEQ